MVAGREGEVLVLLLLLELIDHISQIGVGELGWVPVLSLMYPQVLAYRIRACQRKGRQVEKGGLRFLWVSMIQAGDLGGVSSEGSLSGSVPCITRKGKQR